jgi:hypothetical protein
VQRYLLHGAASYCSKRLVYAGGLHPFAEDFGRVDHPENESGGRPDNKCYILVMKPANPDTKVM